MSRRLLLASSYFPPDGKSGGAEIFALEMARGLAADHGWAVTIVTTEPATPISGEVLPSDIAVCRLPYRRRLSNSPVSLSWPRELRRIITRVDPDVIYVNLPVPGLGDMVSALAGQRPVVVYYHFGSMKKGSPLLDLIIGLYESRVLPFVLRKAQHIACGSDYVKRGILADFTHKASFVYPGVDLARFRPGTGPVSPPAVLYVGSLNLSDGHKRFTDLLEAFGIVRRDLPDLLFNVVGAGDGLPVYKEQAARMGLAESVRFHGRLADDALAEAYRCATVLALPSLRETFGMVISEAMASGLPVVAVNGGAVPSRVDDLIDGLLVPPRDPPAFADALKAIVTDPARASAMGQAGRARVVKQLGWPDQVSAMNELLAAAAGARSALIK